MNKTFTLLKDLVPILARFPRQQRFLLGDRIQNTATDVLEICIEAYYSPAEEKLARLRRANIQLEKLRYFFRLCFELGYYNSLKYQDLARKVDEIGSMIGGWIKSLKH